MPAPTSTSPSESPSQQVTAAPSESPSVAPPESLPPIENGFVVETNSFSKVGTATSPAPTKSYPSLPSATPSAMHAITIDSVGIDNPAVVQPMPPTTPSHTQTQNDLVTCVAVIDETNQMFAETDLLWGQLRDTYPERPFCLLQPNQPTGFPGNEHLYRPAAFNTDEITIFHNVTRDNGSAALASDWYSECDLEAAKRQGRTQVALFVDTSGSLQIANVASAYQLFYQMLAANGFEVVSGTPTHDEDWISPCLTASANSQRPQQVSFTTSETEDVSPTTPPSAYPQPEKPSVSPSARPTVSDSEFLISPSVSPSLISHTKWELEKDEMLALQPDPTLAPTLRPTLDLVAQNELITCISVIDETDPFVIDNNGLWDELRETYPERPFCLLQPNQPYGFPGNERLYRPPAFTNDDMTIFHNVTRDNGYSELTSDWYSLCNLDEARERGLTRVALFVDTSGSMQIANVATSYILFHRMLLANGFEIVEGTPNHDEDWISPCLTASTFDGLDVPHGVPSSVTTVVDSDAPESMPPSLSATPVLTPSMSPSTPRQIPTQLPVAPYSPTIPTAAPTKILVEANDVHTATPSVSASSSQSPTDVSTMQRESPTKLAGQKEGDKFGHAVSFSQDGLIMAVGAPGTDSNTGRVTVFVRVDNEWILYGQELIGVSTGDEFGSSVALSATGEFLLVGSPFHDRNGVDSGQVRTYAYNNGLWEMTGVISGDSAEDNFGYSVAISDDGMVISIGCPNFDESRPGMVRVYAYEDERQEWIQRGRTLVGFEPGDLCGYSVDLSGNGKIVATGHPGSDINGVNSGRAVVYEYVDSDWKELGQSLEGERIGYLAGQAISLSNDGSTVAVGLPGFEANGYQGAIRVYLFVEYTSRWVQRADEVLGMDSSESVGENIVLSSDGSYIAFFSRSHEISDAGGLLSARAFDGNQWAEVGPSLALDAVATHIDIDMSGDGSSIVAGYYSAHTAGAVTTYEFLTNIEAPTTSPISSLEMQNDLITCVSVIDENEPFVRSDIDVQWANFRNNFPLRPFCLLQPNLPGKAPSSAKLARPTKFVSDERATYKAVMRDNGKDEVAEDWYRTCDLATSKSNGVTRVVIFVDNSGTMTTETVLASYNLFRETLELNGFEVIEGRAEKREDYITPCLTASTYNS